MKSVIGIDIGGTITKIGIVSKGAEILKKTDPAKKLLNQK